MDGINGTTFSEQMRLRRRLVLDANDYHPVHTSNRHLGANTTTTTTNLAAAGPDACLTEDGLNGITCWMQCMALPACTNTADSIQCLDLAKTPPSSPLAKHCLTCAPACVAASGSVALLNNTNEFCNEQMGYINMYMTGFVGMADLNSPCLVLFFADWKLDSRTKFSGACFGVVLGTPPPFSRSLQSS
jgi:hypothetical protein